MNLTVQGGGNTELVVIYLYLDQQHAIKVHKKTASLQGIYINKKILLKKVEMGGSSLSRRNVPPVKPLIVMNL